MAANLNVSYDDIQREANSLRQGQQELEQKLQSLQSQIQNLVTGGFVTDQASKRFDEKYNEFTNGAKHTISGLEGLSQYLDQAANTLQETDQNLAGQLG